MKTKKCSKCGLVKPVEEFWKRKYKSKDGFKSHCKECIKKRKLENLKNRTSPMLSRITKKCPICKTVKPAKDFNKNKSRYDGIEASCKECRKKEYRENIDYWKNKNNNYRKIKKEKCKKLSRDYYNKNKKEINETRVKINKKDYRLNSAPPELKPIIEVLILIRKKKKFIKEVKNG